MNILCNFEVMSYPSFEAFRKSAAFDKNILLYLTNCMEWVFFDKNYEKIVYLSGGKDLLGRKIKFGKIDFTIESPLKCKQQTGKVSEERKKEILDIISKCLQRKQISIPQIPNIELEVLTSYLCIVHRCEYHLMFNTWFHAAAGFYNAAKILDDKERELWKRTQEEGEGIGLFLTQPINFLYAFSIEYCLKAVLHFHEHRNTSEFMKVSNTHNISELYQEVKSKLEKEFPDLLKFDNQERLFDKLTMLIKDGKYPYPKNPRKDIMETFEIMENKNERQKDELYYKNKTQHLREVDKKIIHELFNILYNLKNQLWQQMSSRFANRIETD